MADRIASIEQEIERLQEEVSGKQLLRFQAEVAHRKIKQELRSLEKEDYLGRQQTARRLGQANRDISAALGKEFEFREQLMCMRRLLIAAQAREAEKQKADRN